MDFLHPSNLKQDYQRKRKVYISLKEKLSKTKSRNLDAAFHKLHDEAFEQIDCLKCANCCKTTSPIFTNRDIKRISKSLRLSRNGFIKQFLRIDEDEDYVLKGSPCPFLDEKNYCKIYEERPEACSDYPHTTRKRMNKILDLTFENAKVCPAVQSMLSQMNNLL